jgi:hypothetical protein
MDKNKAMELLKQCLDEIPGLREKQYDNQDFKLLVSKIRNIIKNGLDEDDYKTLDFVQDKYFPDELEIDNLLLEQNYLAKLSDYEVALKSIIQKYELRGIEEKPVTNGKKSIRNKIWNEVKDFIATIIAKFAAEKTK